MNAASMTFLAIAIFGVYLFFKKRRKSGVLISAIGLVFAIAVSEPPMTPDEIAASAAADQAAKDVIIAEQAADKIKGFHCLSAMSGQNRKFNALITDQLRDPNSFELIETRIAPKDAQNRHLIFADYRARNGFGGMMTATAKGFLDHETCDPTLISLE